MAGVVVDDRKFKTLCPKKKIKNAQKRDHLHLGQVKKVVPHPACLPVCNLAAFNFFCLFLPKQLEQKQKETAPNHRNRSNYKTHVTTATAGVEFRIDHTRTQTQTPTHRDTQRHTETHTHTHTILVKSSRANKHKGRGAADFF